MKKELNPAQVSAILRTLPVGFYLGTRAPVVLDLAAETSFANMMTREVHVSFRNVEEAFVTAPEIRDAELEGVIRGLLYHEISHLLLTPPDLMKYGPRIFNVLEDARIETLLAKYYHGVNFRDLLRKICSGPKKPANADGLVFNVVRWRTGPAELVRAWDEIVRRNPGFPKSFDERARLVDDYREFLRAVEEAFRKESEKPVPDGADGAGTSAPAPDGGKDGTGTPELGKNGADAGKDEGDAGKAGEDGAAGKAGEDGEEDGPDGGEDGEDEEDGGTAGGESGKPGKGEAKPGEEGDAGQNADGGDGDADGDAPGKLDGDPEAGEDGPEIPEEELAAACKALATRLDGFKNPAVSREVHRIVVRATNKRAGRSGASYGYAGRLDPRAVGTRTDFRWMAKSGDEVAGKLDRINLRLWVDVSGSFSASEQALNTLVSSVLEAEKKLPGVLAVSVIAMGGDDWEETKSANRVWDKTKALRCNEGNDFGPGVEEADRATLKPGWRTVNVVVWDGYLSRCERHGLATARHYYPKAWRPLNNRDTVIVSDDSNEAVIRAMAPNARKTFLSCGYAARFTDEVLKLLGGIL